MLATICWQSLTAGEPPLELLVKLVSPQSLLESRLKTYFTERAFAVVGAASEVASSIAMAVRLLTEGIVKYVNLGLIDRFVVRVKLNNDKNVLIDRSIEKASNRVVDVWNCRI